ncbi:MAG: FG-GAP-like repeat-containing protein [Acidobacteriota bacterium]
MKKSLYLCVFLASGVIATAAEIPFYDARAIARGLTDPSKIFLADLDGDGRADLLSASFGDEIVAWSRNLGKDSAGQTLFGSRQTIAAAPAVFSPTGVLAIDVDGDGDLDVLSSSFADAKIAWYENLGTGNFGDPATNQKVISTGAIGAFAVSAADIDGDGDVDVLSASQSDSRIVWYENSGAPAAPGEWTFHDVSTAAMAARQVIAADLDADGDLDLLSASVFGNPIAWYENLGGGVFGDAATNQRVISSTVLSGRAAVAGDVDGDGDLDPISASCVDNTVAWYENSGSTTTGIWNQRVVSSTAACPESVFAADLDQDGDIDILSASSGGTLNWFENVNGLGMFATARPLASAFGGIDARAGDMDGDGDLDVVGATALTGEIAWFENRTIHGNSTFAPASIIDSAVDVTAVVAADLDRDGSPDAVAGSGADGSLAWWHNDEQGLFSQIARDISLNSPGTEAIVAADLDGDGDLDVASATTSSGSRLAWHRNLGAGDFGADSIIDASGVNYRTIDSGDIDGDGDLDLLAGGNFNEGSTPGVLTWLENTDGNGTFSARPNIPTGIVESIASVHLADLDGDGDLDIITGGVTSALGSVDWFANDGAGNFSPAAGIDTTSDPIASVTTTDVDGDGDRDVVAGRSFAVSWYENVDGHAGAFGPARSITASVKSVRSVFAADVDRDGDADVLAASSDDNLLSWYENLNGAGNFGPQQTVDADSVGARSIVTADIDSDGDLDVLSASPLGLALAWSENRGGQYSFSGSDLAPARAPSGQVIPLLSLTATLHARPGDSPGEVTSLALLFEQAPGVPLTTEEANGLIDALRVYRDTGSGMFEAGDDLVVTTVQTLALGGGVQTVLFGDGDALARLAAPATFFVVAELSHASFDLIPDHFRVTHLAPSSVVEDFRTDLPLAPATLASITSTITTAFQPLVVTTTADRVDDADGVSSLREAVQDANSRPGPDLILLGPGTYTLSIAGAGENAAASGDLDVTDSSGTLTIQGAGAPSPIIEASGIDRVFEIIGASLTLEGVTITGGMPPEGTSRGGGIGHFCCSTGTTTLINSVVTGNTASFSGGVDNNSPNGSIIVLNSTLTGNSSGFGSAMALAFGAVTVSGSTISGNTGSAAVVISQDTIGTIDSSTITGNDTGLSSSSSTPLRLSNTVVAGNTTDLTGSFNLAGHNLIGNLGAAVLSSTTVTDQIGGEDGGPAIDALLGPLQLNNGPTPNHALLAGSPAIDAGNCSGQTTDQRGAPRPVDLSSVPNVTGGDGCDIGAIEDTVAQTLTVVNVPVRWCGVVGAPSLPTTAAAANAELLSRSEAATSNVLAPVASIRVRSGATATFPSFPLLTDPDTTIGNPGDVVVDPAARNYDEVLQLFTSCRTAWEQGDPSVVGITAVQINQFVDPARNALGLLGVGGRAEPLNAPQQAVAGRVMIVDPQHLVGLTPADSIERILAHEFGHALSLPHGNGMDDDLNGVLDDNDDRFLGLPRFDGPNLMHYRTGSQLTDLQIGQARLHAVSTIPDTTLSSSLAVDADDVPIDEGFIDILDFGFIDILDFGFIDILDFGFIDILDFAMNETLDFGFVDILDFGMSIGTEAPDETTLFTSTGGLLWPQPIRVDSSYYFYLDLDMNPATGGTPSDFGFPGAGVAAQTGVDLIAQVDVTATGQTLTVHQFVDSTTGFVVVPNPVAEPTRVENVSVGLFQRTGGAAAETDDQAIGINVRAQIKNSVLEGAGWTVGDPLTLETLSTVTCSGILPAGFTIDCQCMDCAVCPDFPGCAATGTPDTIDPVVVTDCVNADLDFTPPLLPACLATPGEIVPGGSTVVTASHFPAGAGNVEVLIGSTVLGSSPVDGSGDAVIPVTIPSGTTGGPLVLTTRIPGLATEATCGVQVSSQTSVCAPDLQAPSVSVTDSLIVAEQTTCGGTPVDVLTASGFSADDLCDGSPAVALSDAGPYPLGDTVVTITATDATGNSAAIDVTVRIEDTTPPALSVPAPLVVTSTQLTVDGIGCAKIDNPAISAWLAGASATDVCATGTAIAHDAPDTFPVNTTTVTFTATDPSGNMTQATSDVQVVYEFSGFGKPLMSDGSASVKQGKKGRTIPVKFALSCGGTPVATAVASIGVFQISNADTGTVDTTDLTEDSGTANDGGNLFRFDPNNQQYIFNLSTTGFAAPATYRIVVGLDDGTEKTVEFSLRP